MAFRKITEGDMLGKGNVGRPDTPGVSTAEMQRMQLRHQEETAKLTSQLAEAVRQATCAAKISAGGACQSDPQTEP